MANKVFANGREVACKAGSGKTIAAFPDVCMTPPQTPATPPGVPIPYPNTGKASDLDKGSKKVKISEKPVCLKNKSYFKTSMGDEAGSAPMKGVVSHKTKGKVYFQAWSSDVKVEGKNACRHLDMTTNNHGSFPGDTPPWVYIDSQAMTSIADCTDEVNNAKTACEGKTTKEDQCKSKKCRDAKRCLLVTYSQGKRKGKKSKTGCCDGEQPHHLVEAHCFYEVGKRGKSNSRTVKTPRGKRTYSDKHSPCVCATGPRHEGEHGKYHAFQQKIEAAHNAKNGSWTYKDARDTGALAHSEVNSQCSKECTSAQLDAYHKDRCGMDDSTKLRTDPQAGTRSTGKLNSSQKKKLQTEVDRVKGVTSTSGST